MVAIVVVTNVVVAIVVVVLAVVVEVLWRLYIGRIEGQWFCLCLLCLFIKVVICSAVGFGGS